MGKLLVSLCRSSLHLAHSNFTHMGIKFIHKLVQLNLNWNFCRNQLEICMRIFFKCVHRYWMGIILYFLYHKKTLTFSLNESPFYLMHSGWCIFPYHLCRWYGFDFISNNQNWDVFTLVMSRNPHLSWITIPSMHLIFNFFLYAWDYCRSHSNLGHAKAYVWL